MSTKVEGQSVSPNDAKPVVGRSASTFKVGQCVSYGGATCWVKKYNGEKCLAYPALLGWSYFIPGDWNLVEVQ